MTATAQFILASCHSVMASAQTKIRSPQPEYLAGGGITSKGYEKVLGVQVIVRRTHIALSRIGNLHESLTCHMLPPNSDWRAVVA